MQADRPARDRGARALFSMLRSGVVPAWLGTSSALAMASPPVLVGAEAWVVDRDEAYPIALSGPATVDPRAIGERPMTLAFAFDQPVLAVRRVEATSGNAMVIGFSPGDTEVVVEVNGVADAGYATVSLIDVVGNGGIVPVVDGAIGVSPGDFAIPARTYDLADIDAFIVLFQDGDRRADMDLSGFNDLGDLDAFITAYFASDPAQPRPPRVTPIADAFAPAGGTSRPVRFRVRDDRVFEHELVLTATSTDPTVVSDADIALVRTGGDIELVVSGPAGGNGQTTIVVTATNGFETTTRMLAVTVRADTAPTTKFSMDPFLGAAPLPVRFDGRASTDELNNIASWTWDFGDGSIASGATAQHTYSAPGSYDVTLTTTDDSGLTDAFTRTVTVAEPGFDASIEPVSRFDAKRFLWQAAFGPTEADIAFIQANGYEAWIDQQLATPKNAYDPAIFEASDDMGFGGTKPDQYFDDYAVEGADQLKQRIAWALIQIVVMNLDQNGSDHAADSLYYDAYMDAATGNFRDLLEFVTYSNPMGVYLTYRNSSKANPVTGSVPDENYAREIKQLFTIGLDAIDGRGVPVRDIFGDTVPLYDNDDITEFARVFTGFRRQGDSSNPMIFDLNAHDFEAKQLLDYPGAVPPGGVLPAGDGSSFAFATDIALTLDNLFFHPSHPPFIARQLIQRFVTSNPTGDYVGRVAEAYAGGGPFGTGQRGDIAATVKAILLDPEARDTTYSDNPAFGKPMEPYLTALGLMRATGRAMNPDRPFPFNRVTVNVNQTSQNFAQGFMKSPSVFNFYLPDFTPPQSDLDRARLVAPELQIHTSSTNFEAPNEWHDLLFTGSNATYPDDINAAANLDDGTIVDLMVDQWYHRPLSPEIRQVIVDAMTGINSDRNGVRAAARLLMSNPEFTILR